MRLGSASGPSARRHWPRDIPCKLRHLAGPAIYSGHGRGRAWCRAGGGRAKAGEMGTLLKRAAKRFGGWGVCRHGRNIGGLAHGGAVRERFDAAFTQAEFCAGPFPFFSMKNKRATLPQRKGRGNYAEIRGRLLCSSGECAGQGMAYHAPRSGGLAQVLARRSLNKRRRVRKST